MSHVPNEQTVNNYVPKVASPKTRNLLSNKTINHKKDVSIVPCPKRATRKKHVSNVASPKTRNLLSNKTINHKKDVSIVASTPLSPNQPSTFEKVCRICLNGRR
jgi:hypothetical protein